MSEFPVLNALVFAALGVLVFVVAFAIVVKLAPLNLWKEIVRGAQRRRGHPGWSRGLGLCWIIAAAMH